MAQTFAVQAFMQARPGVNSLTPGTFPAPVPFNPAAGTDPVGTLTNVGCNLISNPTARAACIAAAALLRPRSQSSGNNGAPAGGLVASGCPTGFRPGPNGVGCVRDDITQYLPGDIGRPDYGWNAVNGRYGAGYVPLETGRTVRICPPGAKLGKDGVCYDRIARSNRLHDPGARPFLTGGEVNAIRRAKRLQKRFQNLRAGKNALFPSSPARRRK